jgi:hypothetical protein
MDNAKALRKAVRRGLYLRFKREQPTTSRPLLRQMAKATERVAWYRRDPALVAQLSRTLATPAPGGTS